MNFSAWYAQTQKQKLQAQTEKGDEGGRNLYSSQGRHILWFSTEAESLLTPIWMVRYTHCYANWLWSTDRC